MPHLDMDSNNLDLHFPTLSVPHDVDDGHEELWDSWDKVLQRGLEIVAEIQARMTNEGRRRCEQEAVKTMPSTTTSTWWSRTSATPGVS